MSSKLERFRLKCKKEMENELDYNLLDKECLCCYETKPCEEFVKCESNHMACNVCVLRHAENTIYQNASYKISCINTENACMSLYSETVLCRVLKPQTFIEYNKIKTKEEMKYIFELDGLNLIQCKFCDAYWDNNNRDLVLNCGYCYKSTCLKCNEQAHEGKACESKRKNIEDKLTEAVILQCKKCNKSIYKEDGCNKVTCPCGTIMCWICKSTIDGYGHFCNNCPQIIRPGCTCCHVWDLMKKDNVINKLGNLDNEEQELAKILLRNNKILA